MANKGGGAVGVRREYAFTRVVDAPRGDVFNAWTDPQRLGRWWGPAGFSNPVCELDLRPGGAIRIHMRAPDGAIYPMLGEFREISRPERLVIAVTPLDANGRALFEQVATATFAERGEQTEVTVRLGLTNVTPAAAPYLEGMEDGWNQCLDRLAGEFA